MEVIVIVINSFFILFATTLMYVCNVCVFVYVCICVCKSVYVCVCV